MDRPYDLTRLGLAWAAVLLLGCGSKPTPPSFTSAVAPPFGLDQIRGGMSAAEAMAKVPGVLIEPNTPTSSTLGMGGLPAGTHVYIRREDDRIAQVEVKLDSCGELGATLAKAWGAGHGGTSEDGPSMIWASAETGWVAGLRRAAGDGCSLRFTSAAYFGAPATPPGVLARVRPGMTAAQLADAEPSFRIGAAPFPDWALGDVTLSVVPTSDGRVLATVMRVPADVREAMVMRWGSGTIVDPTTTPQRFWIDETTRRRAHMPEVGFAGNSLHEMTFDGFEPIDGWFGDGKAITAVPGPLIGVAIGDVHRRRGAGARPPQVVVHSASLFLDAPATMWTRDSTTQVLVTAFDPNGKEHDPDALARPVTSVSWWINYESQPERDRIIEVCTRKWGAPVEPARGEWRYPQPDGTTLQVRDMLGQLWMSLLVPSAFELQQPR